MYVVDFRGNRTGETVDRWEAHTSPGVKHLAFAIFVQNKKNEFILHKRPNRKVGGDKWDTPVSHVLEGETEEEAMQRCLKEEYGIDKKVEFEHFGGFSYEERYPDGTCENEFCLVSVCKYNGKIVANEKEVEELKKLPVKEAVNEWKNNFRNYTIWFNKSVSLLSKKGFFK